MNLSAIIMELEKVAHELEQRRIHPEQAANELERQAEQLFRIAGRIRHGREV